MSTTSRVCNRSEVEHIRKFLAYANMHVNGARYYPPLNGYRWLVALALYSKCLTAAEATLVLIEAGFGDEAFGMTRTLIDVYFSLRYIANKDTEERAKSYYEFFAKDIEDWTDVIRVYLPHLLPAPNLETKSIAARYRRPHSWSGKPLSAMALEPCTFETDPTTGQPAVHGFPYKAMFRWTSHYVHPSVVALNNHLVKPGHDNFVVRSNEGKNMSHLAAFGVCTSVAYTLIAFYRCMGDPQPACLANWASALVKHVARRHQ